MFLHLIQTATPYLAFIAALAAATVGIGVLWAKIVGPLLGMTLLREVHERITEISARQHAEFENGVPFGDERYVPLRRAFDRYSKADAERWARHDADADLVRARLGIVATSTPAVVGGV